MIFEDWSDYLISKLFNKFGNKIYELGISSNKNITWNYIENNSKNWNYKHMSFNPNITFNVVLNNPYKDWNLEALSHIFTINPHDYFKFYNDYHNYKIYLEFYLPLEDIKYYENKYNYNIQKKYLSCNPFISWDFIIQNLDYNWNFRSLSKYNKNITPYIILNNPQYFDNECIKNLSINPYITYENIKKYPEINWNYKNLSKNKNITIDIVLENLDKDWNFDYLIINKNITLEIIKKYNQFNWNKKLYTENPNFRLSDLDEFTEYDNFMIKNICTNNFDMDRKNFCEKHNININNFYTNILFINMFDYVCI